MVISRLCLWSGPRNVSTALMYAFAQRPDTRVLDEPLYAHYLRSSGVEHPGRDEVLTAQDSDGETVVREVILGPCDRPILFMKQMAHHLVDLDLEFLTQTVNVLLVRNPSEMLRSLHQQLPRPRLADTGLKVQVDLLRRLKRLGQDPPVLESRQLLLDPRGVLERLCERLAIPFDPAMLHWRPGPRPEDGVWARHWYHNVHRSSGFEPYRRKEGELPEALAAVEAECRPFYDELYRHAIRADPSAEDPDRRPERGSS